jgi:23S rRNA (uracil1939-C5)-methyltransferase
VSELVERIAAKGDGVTASGRHVKGALPGDSVDAEGLITPGPHHVAPPCRHFDRCGGCQLQHADDAALREFVTSRVDNAARRQGLEAEALLPTHLSPPRTRRRASLQALRTQAGVLLGFREAGSHRVIDLKQCEVLLPEMVAMLPALRRLLAPHIGKGGVEVSMAACDQGIDLGLSNLALDTLEVTQALLDHAGEAGLARLSVDQGFGPETIWEPEPATITLSGVPVPMPVGAFLQATADAEALMIADAREWLGGTGAVVDLFAGLGTFAFGLGTRAEAGRKVLAVEADRAAHLACKAAAGRTGGSVFAMHRDLFRNPLTAGELDRFDAALLDPPRAGARAQIAELANSKLARIVYVSCNPSSWSRDAAVLAEAGFRLAGLRPVGQFRWSTHVELVSLFTR